jgi:hypothetical protein
MQQQPSGSSSSNPAPPQQQQQQQQAPGQAGLTGAAPIIQGLREKAEKAPKHGVNGKYLIIQAARLLAQQEKADQPGASSNSRQKPGACCAIDPATSALPQATAVAWQCP